MANDAEFNERRVREIATHVMEADIDPRGLSAADMLDDDQGALLCLQIELAIIQVVERMNLRRTASITLPLTVPRDGRLRPIADER